MNKRMMMSTLTILIDIAQIDKQIIPISVTAREFINMFITFLILGNLM